MEIVRSAIQGTKWLLTVVIRMDDERIGQAFNADVFDACFMAVIEEASRWISLVIYSLPRIGMCKVFHIVPPLKNLMFFGLDHGCDLGSFFVPLMTAIVTTSTPHLTGMSLGDLNTVVYLARPGRLHVFCSLTTLTIWLYERMENPANILPYLQRLEELTAWHLHLPFYPSHVTLPLIQTLRNLRLKSVSVQWMAGRVFPVLRRCSIIFPHWDDSISDQPVAMPACTSLGYDSNDLYPLKWFHDLPLDELTVQSGQWNVTRGNFQLMAICHMIVPCAQSLTKLNIQVRCSEKLLTCMLSLLPALKSLKLGLISPRALNETFFQAFVVTKSNADDPREMGGMSRLPLCSKLLKLKVSYKRWLRGSERTALLLVFGDIVSSHHPEEDFRLHLIFDDRHPGWMVRRHGWMVRRHVESIHEAADNGLFVIGISSPHGIIPMVMPSAYPLEVPVKEAEYLVVEHQMSIGCLSTLHHLVELRIGGVKDILPSEPPPNLPLCRTLRVLEAENIHPSFLAGQTFHKLERCRMSLYGEGPNLRQDPVTQMPVCTRLDVDDPTLLATLKLPQICELGASFDHPEFNMIWEKHIVVNANLSGLELLHVYGWFQQADLIQALRCLPVLKTMILANGSDLDAAFFEEFVPMHPNETTVLMQSHDEGQISAILCPMLRGLVIEGCSPSEQAKLIPVLEKLVILRAVFGSPLERFTLSDIEFGRKFELIGRQGGFVTEMGSMDEDAKPFRLYI